MISSYQKLFSVKLLVFEISNSNKEDQLFGHSIHAWFDKINQRVAQLLPLQPDHDLQVPILTPGYPQIGHGDAVSLEKIIHESKLKVQRVSRKYRAVPRSSSYDSSGQRRRQQLFFPGSVTLSLGAARNCTSCSPTSRRCSIRPGTFYSR